MSEPMVSVSDVVKLVRTALHDPDPISRAEARALLEGQGLPVSPQAVLLAGRRHPVLTGA